MKKNLSILLAIVFLFTTAFGGFAGVAQAAEVNHRIAGVDRYETAHKIAGDTAETVIIVRGDSKGGTPNVVDGLTASVLAGAKNAPILLTDSAKLPGKTEAAIKGLGAKKAYIIGGDVAVNADVEAELVALGLTVERIKGDTRFETAVKVAQAANTGSKTAIIAQSHALVDSLVAGPLAYTKQFPILLVGKDTVGKTTEDAIKDLGIENLIIIGGTGVVSAKVETQLKALVTGDVDRLSGANRELTSLDVAKEFNTSEVLLVNGYSFVDAVAASTLGLPILYVSADKMHADVEAFLATKAGFKAIGGPVAISNAVVNKAAAAVIAELQVVSVSAIDSTTIQAEFNKAITKDAKITVKRDGGANVNIAKLTLAEDKKSATLELPQKFVAGDYTLTLVEGEETLTYDFKLEDEKVAKIEIPFDKAPVNDNATPIELKVAYVVYNQYGEDITDITAITATTSQGTVNAGGTGDGVVTIDGTFTISQYVHVSVLHGTTGTFASRTVQIASKTSVERFEVKGLHHATLGAPRAGASTTGYKLLVTAFDQYGKALAQDELGTAGTDFVMNSSNPSVVELGAVDTSSTVTVDGKEYIAIDLSGTTFGQGTTTFNLISATTGKRASYVLEVPAALAVHNITLGAPTIAVAGEVIRIPYTAVDQNGNAVTNLTTLNSVNFAISNAPTGLVAADHVEFVRNFVTNETFLELDTRGVAAANAITTNRNITLIATTVNGTVAQRAITLRPNAQAAAVSGIKDMEANLMNGATQAVAVANLTFIDQYGRTMTTAPTVGSLVGNYQIVVTSNNANVTVNGSNTANISGAAVTLAGATKGTSNITISLVRVTETTPSVVTAPVANSSYRYVANVLNPADIVSIEVGTIRTLRNALATKAGHADATLKVYGVDAHGNKALIPANQVVFNSSISQLAYGNDPGAAATYGKLSVSPGITGWSDTVVKRDLGFIVTAYGNQAIGTVAVSNEDKVITTLEIKATADATAYNRVNATTLSVIVANKDSIAAIVDDLVIKDQYGATMTNTAGTTLKSFIASEFRDANGDRVTNILDVPQGGSYTLTVLLPNGTTQAFTVRVR